MKLRNKKTGEIMNLVIKCENGGELKTFDLNTNTDKPITLAELNEEWEDYEEPKEHWHIRDGEVYRSEIKPCIRTEKRKEIGNYFETKEQAERAVEKLKAWKRLKDKGFDIEGWENHIGDNYYKTGQIVLNLNNVRDRNWDEYDNINEIKEDLDLLFGGEE